MKHLTKFETTAAYEAAESSLILPNVSLCVSENEVHYKPSTPVPPTPSLVITAITKYDYDKEDDVEVETPFCDNGMFVQLHFSRPVSWNELLNLVIEGNDCYNIQSETIIYRASINEEGDVITWGDEGGGLYFYQYSFEGTVDHIGISHNDFDAYYNRIYFE